MEQNIYRLIFDALPALVFIVDENVQIQECNAAAEELVGAASSNFLKQRAGQILKCLHSKDAPGGCGAAPYCKSCIVRNSVQEACCGNKIVRRRTRLEIVRDGEILEIFAFISASPFIYDKQCMVLLVIEDISEIAELKRIITICSVCRKVRNEEQSWIWLEAYFNDQWGVDFSHGLCPECHTREMEKLKKQIEQKQKEISRPHRNAAEKD